MSTPDSGLPRKLKRKRGRAGLWSILIVPFSLWVLAPRMTRGQLAGCAVVQAVLWIAARAFVATIVGAPTNPKSTLPGGAEWYLWTNLRTLTYPLYGSFLDLENLRTDLAGVKAIAIYGKSQKLRVNTGAAAMHFLADDGLDKLALKPEDVVTILEPLHLPLDSNGFIPDWTSSFAFRKLRVLDSSGRTGTLKARLSDFTAGRWVVGTARTPSPAVRAMVLSHSPRTMRRRSEAVPSSGAASSKGANRRQQKVGMTKM